MKFTKKIFIAFFLFLFLFQINGQNISEPKNFYLDKANVLSQQQKQFIVKINKILKTKTGSEIAILTENKLENRESFQYSVDVFEKWKPGDKNKDNGMLILFIKNDTKIEVRSGYGVEGYLPDGKIGRFIDNYFIPYAKKTQYGKGLISLTYAYGSVIAKNNNFNLKNELNKNSYSSTVAAKRRRVNSEKKGGLLPIGAIILFIILYIFPPTRPFALMLLFMFLRRGNVGGNSGFGGGFGGFGGGSTGGGGASRDF